VIKVVIFDVGGVLIRTPDRSSRLAWERRFNLAEWESEEIVFNGEMGTKAQLGQISDAALWRWVGRRLKLSEIQLSEFRRDFWSGDILDVKLVDAIRGLKPRYQTAIISNATDALRDSLTSTYPIADAFDLIVVSAEERIMKPDHEIYERTLRRLSRPAKEAVFIDDNPGNIAAARELGMASILFKPTVDLQLELTRLGVRFSEETADPGPGTS
jgi:putative hydrolase of the HAD superfamily